MKSNWTQFLEKALSLRSVLFTESKTDCFRLFNGSAEGIPGLVIEQYGKLIIFQVFEGECQLNDEQMKMIAEWILEKRKASSVYRKEFVADRSRKTAGADYYSNVPFAGTPSEKVVSCQENGVKFEVRPFSGYSTGIFLDQRNNREWLASQSRGKEVLNLFSYTCLFSVACALQGARTTSVDLSQKYLDWGKKNFEANQIELSLHRFIAEDTFKFLKQATKKKVQFDVAIVDPPSFSRTKEGKVFSLKKDFERLLEYTLPVVAPSGLLFFSCNLSEWNSDRLLERAEKVLEVDGGWTIIETPRAPRDFISIQSGLSQFAAIKQLS